MIRSDELNPLVGTQTKACNNCRSQYASNINEEDASLCDDQNGKMVLWEQDKYRDIELCEYDNVHRIDDLM